MALFTVTIWGTTFISTKILLRDFSPVEVLFIRFFIALIALSIAYPHRLKVTNRKHEWYFAAAGLLGTVLYFLLENIALTYSTASDVGVIISVIPFFTAIFSYFFNKEKLNARFFLGFVIAIAGIALISLNGREMKLNPLGDILTILAAMVWALYSVLVKKISRFEYNTIQTTRRIFLYGVILMIPTMKIFHVQWDAARFARLLKTTNLLNVLYLGLCASAICFVTWNLAVKSLGAVKTSIYTYLGPVITIIASAIFLQEQITALIVGGTALTLIGLVISQNPFSWGIGQKISRKSGRRAEVKEDAAK